MDYDHKMQKPETLPLFPDDPLKKISEKPRSSSQERIDKQREESTSPANKLGLYDRWKVRLKNNPVVALILLLVVVVIGLGTFTDSLDKIISFGKKHFGESSKSSDSEVKRQDPLTKTEEAHKPKSRQNLPQTTKELEEHLRVQIHFLQRSSKYFDSGLVEEAKRMASSLYVLLSAEQDFPSLLSQLRIQEEMLYMDSAREDIPGNLAAYSALTVMHVGSKGTTPTYEPNLVVPTGLDPAPKWTLFEAWWNKTIIDDKKGGKFSRGSLILIIAKRDGGSSVASTLDEDYIRLSRKNALGWAKSGEKPFLGVELAAMRQITHEFLSSIKRVRPQFFDTIKETEN